MKRKFVTSSYDPFASALGYNTKEQTIANKYSAMLMSQAKENLPSVEMDITSYRINKGNPSTLRLTGDMTYEGNNRWLTIDVEFGGDLTELDFKYVVFEYLRQVKLAYGLEAFEDTDLMELASKL